MCCNVLQCVAVFCSAAARCSVLQCVATHAFIAICQGLFARRRGSFVERSGTSAVFLDNAILRKISRGRHRDRDGLPAAASPTCL